MKIRVPIISLVLFTLAACGGQTQTGDRDAIAYEQYQEIFDRIGMEVKVDGFHYAGGSTGANVTIVDPELTFGTRSYLTIDGTFNGGMPLTTQETIIFEHVDQDLSVLIKLSYSDIVMRNDMINYSNDLSYAGTNQARLEKSDLAVLSYRNLFIIIQQLSGHRIQSEFTEKFIKGIIDIVTQY